MRETRDDTVEAIVFALLLHALLFGALVLGLWWTRSAAPAAAGGAVSADVVDVGSLSAAMQRALQQQPEAPPVPEKQETPLPQPVVEPEPQDAPAPQQQQAQELLPVPDTESQEAVVEQPAAQPSMQATPQEAKRRQEQVDLTERERQLEAEQKRRLAEQSEMDRRIAEIRRKRAAAAREATLAEQRLQQLADARRGTPAEDAARADAAASAGAGGTDDGLRARYAAALQAAILAKWTRPENVPLGQRCRIYITQIVGGEVIRVEFDPSCPYDEMGRRSVEAAVRKAAPLPYAGFESVFSRRLNLNFEAQDQ